MEESDFKINGNDDENKIWGTDWQLAGINLRQKIDTNEYKFYLIEEIQCDSLQWNVIIANAIMVKNIMHIMIIINIIHIMY